MKTTTTLRSSLMGLLIVMMICLGTTRLQAQNCWKTFTCGVAHTVAISNDGSLWTWGDNSQGQLGDYTNISQNHPKQISTANNWKIVVAKGSFTMAIKTDGTLWGWGDNSYSQLGNGLNYVYSDHPIQIGTDNNWQSVACGAKHTLAIKTNGTLWGWGDNQYGQLGVGAVTIITTPVQINSNTNWRSVACGWQHTLAIKTDSSLWVWGKNDNGEVGDGTIIQKNYPTRIGIATDWQSVAGGGYFSFAIKGNNSLWAWGINDFGQLGDSTNSQQTTPTSIDTTTDWLNVSAGFFHAIAIKTDNTLWSWGYNTLGQLGDGTTVDENIPVKIGTSTNWKAGAGGVYYTAAMRNDESLLAWGDNASGQLGDSTIIDRYSPIAVACPPTTLLLPVKLVAFTGGRQGINNLLHWATASEQNNKGFELQRSANGEHFSKVAFVHSKAVNGNSTGELNYAFTDNSQLTTHHCYYRLKQVDNDGKATLSNVVLIKGEMGDESIVLSLFPNPGSTRFTLIVNSSNTQPVSIRVMDAVGNIVYESKGNAADSFRFGEKFANGTYLVEVRQGEVKKTVKAVRMK